MSSPEKIPVVVLTGFLGSGKTMLLNALLRQPGFADTAVIVNEFGEIGLDHLLVSSAQENIVLLDAGCLCCAVLGSLKETLADLHHRRARGEVPPFRRVLIETTGLADPGPIMQSVMRDSLVTHYYRLAGVICVVDALRAEAQLAEHPEARAQIAYADRLVISKTDCTGGAFSATLRAGLQALNKEAELIVASFGQVEAASLLRSVGRDGTALPWLGPSRPGHAHADEGHGDHPLHDSTIGSESFWVDGPATWAGLAAWIEVVRRRYGRDLLRCKGIVNVGGDPVVVHGVQTMFDTRRLPAWPDDEKRSRLVLIGKGLQRPELAASLGWLAAPEGTLPPLDPTMAPPPDLENTSEPPAAPTAGAFDAP